MCPCRIAFSDEVGNLRPQRSGVALIGAMAALVMVGVFATAIVSFHMATRRTIDQSHRVRQVEYLARSGVEFAVSELLQGRDGEFGETYRPLENSEVSVRVVPGEDDPDLVRISSRAELRPRPRRDRAENEANEEEEAAGEEDQEEEGEQQQENEKVAERDKREIVREIARQYRLIRTEGGDVERCEFVSFVD